MDLDRGQPGSNGDPAAVHGGRRGRGGRRLWPALVAAALVCCCLAAAGLALLWPLPPTQATVVPAPSIEAYRGLGAWIDLFDAAAWKDPAAAVLDLHHHHVRTLFLETSNYSWPAKLNQPAALARFITACHARGMRIVAWYLPDFSLGSRDYSRSMAAVRFRTAGGQRFDSFGLDIEASMVKPVSGRNHRLIVLSQRLRNAVGPSYPLGAVIPSPVGMSTNATYWPVFPYARLAGLYDVMLPMGYYTYHGDGATPAYQETLTNIAIIRDQTGSAGIPIHIIGGLAASSSGDETQAFVRAARESGVIGASIYDWATSDQADWAALRNVRTNPRQTPPLPVDLGYTAPLGRCPGDTTHPKEVFIQTVPQDGDRVLRYRLYDAQEGEVHLLVDWHDLGPLPAGPAGAWTETRQITVPAADLDPAGRNVIGFVARGTYPQWTTWGVRDVELVTP